MFGFLNGTALFAAFAALIPLIIHLFSRRRVKVVDFSSVRHLKAMQKRQVRRLKIRQLLLLILRMLIILAVVLAFARPTTRRGMIGTHASVSAIILFDNSASMNRYVADGNLFDLAKKRTVELLQTFGQSDQVMLLPLAHADEGTPTPQFASSALAEEQLSRIRCGYGEADLQSALQTASDQISKSANLNREIYFVTDRQRHSLPATEGLKDTAARVYLVDLPVDQVENAGITALDFGGQLIQPGIDFNITATVKNYGSSDRNDIIASLFLDGKRTAQTDVIARAGADAPARFTRAVAAGGFHSGYVELSDDKFLPDNRYYFSFYIPEQFSLLIIDGDEGSRFLQLALSPATSLPRSWSVKSARPDQLTGVNLGEYDVIALVGAPTLGAGIAERLRSLVKQGKSLFVTYGPGTDIASFNQEWSEVTGVRYDQGVRQGFSRAGYYTLKSIDLQHPIFSVFGLEANKPPEVKFYTLPTFSVNKEARALMTFSGDHPAFVEHKYGAGKVLTFTGPITPQYTDFVTHAFFVPLVSRSAEYLAANLSSFDIHLFAGGTISRGLSPKMAVQTSIQMIAPDSTRYELAPEDAQGNLVVHPRPTDVPGIYSLTYQMREIDRFAVNVNPAECELASADPDQFAASLGSSETKELDVNDPLATKITESRYGRELWQIFLWLAVVLLAVEMLLARSAAPEE
ncbi:MAG: BatA domain-containing protein [Candidatus Zixiibacteriota bacterium]